MKMIKMFVGLFLISYSLIAQDKIPVDSAGKHIGNTVTICSEVFGVKSTDKVTYINVGGQYPNSPLTLVIFTKDLVNFSDTPAKMYGNKSICVTGKISEYKGKPQIVITKPGEIVVK